MFVLAAGLSAAAAGCDVNEAKTPGSTDSSSTTTTSVTAPSPPPSTSASNAATSGSSTEGLPAAAIAGDWSSPSCGNRKYPRQISFNDKGGFSAADLVSPCPKDVACVWSGIVNRQGTWSSDGHQITLTVSGNPGSQGASFPGTLELSPGPAEKDASGATCVYQRAKP